MIAFTEIVGDEFGHRPAEMAFTERDHLAQALLLDRPHDPLRMTPCSLAHTAAFASGASPSRRATPPLPDSTSIAIADHDPPVPIENTVHVVTIEVTEVRPIASTRGVGHRFAASLILLSCSLPGIAAPGDHCTAPQVGRCSSRRPPSSLHAGTRRGLSSCGVIMSCAHPVA
jgi:hypothetical protein